MSKELKITVEGPFGAVTFGAYESDWIVRKLAYGLDSEGSEADPDTREEIGSWARRVMEPLAPEASR